MGEQYVLDASVLVKMLNQEREQDADKALGLMDRGVAGTLNLCTSDFATHEIINALLKGKNITGELLRQTIEHWFILPIERVDTDVTLASRAADIAQRQNITFYDAIYCAIAFERGIPLITANPKHQRPMPGVIAISLAQWNY
ncbi:type II toxin-antitoxin system VapC family toxin [Candidatus Uhrbacteria bacterium]|nr:type II toxin-antitoxin system VapC family toxin [Candidatus Uhrbacteria bacterium]